MDKPKTRKEENRDLFWSIVELRRQKTKLSRK
jgi:hypothetical protein